MHKKRFANLVFDFDNSEENVDNVLKLVTKLKLPSLVAALELLIEQNPEGKISASAVKFLEEAFTKQQTVAMSTVIKIGNITISIPEHTGGHDSPYISFHVGRFSKEKSAALSYDKGMWHINRASNTTASAISEVLKWAKRNTDAILEVWADLRSGKIGKIDKRQKEIDKEKKSVKANFPSVFSYHIVSIKTQAPYYLHIEIDEPYKLKAVIDMEPHIEKYKVYAPLHDPKMFAKVQDFWDHINWPRPDILISVKEILDEAPRVSSEIL